MFVILYAGVYSSSTRIKAKILLKGKKLNMVLIVINLYLVKWKELEEKNHIKPNFDIQT